MLRALVPISALALALGGCLPVFAQDDGGATEVPSHLFRWNDRRGVPHLTNVPPHEYEVSREEWLRLKSEYPGMIKDEEPVELDPSLADLGPGPRAEQALRGWWNIAVPRGAYRGHAIVTPDERTELDRLLLVAKDALREARGKDLSPATGRAATEYRRVMGVRMTVLDAAERSGMMPDQLYPVTISGRLVRGVSSVRYEVAGRISNRSLSDANGLSVSLYLQLDGEVVATREVVVPRVMARGEAPLDVAFELPATFRRLDEARLSLRSHVEHLPEPPAIGG